MPATARHTDPDTSHEAAAGVDLIRSQMAVLTYARTHMGSEFTDKQLVAHYLADHTGLPALSASRIRTARLELAAAGLLRLVGTTKGTARRERVWTLTDQEAQA